MGKPIHESPEGEPRGEDHSDQVFAPGGAMRSRTRLVGPPGRGSHFTSHSGAMRVRPRPTVGRTGPETGRPRLSFFRHQARRVPKRGPPPTDARASMHYQGESDRVGHDGHGRSDGGDPEILGSDITNPSQVGHHPETAQTADRPAVSPRERRRTVCGTRNVAVRRVATIASSSDIGECPAGAAPVSRLSPSPDGLHLEGEVLGGGGRRYA